MKLRKLGILVATASVLLLLSGCQSQKQSKGTVKIGILQLIDQRALNQAKQGFTSELAKQGYRGKKVKIDFMNANGDQSNLKAMSDRLARDHNQLNLAIATPAAQALQVADPQTPLVFTAITDPKSAGLVTTPQKPDKNATGVTDLVDVKGQIDFTHKLFPKAKKIGLLYNAAEANSVFQINLAKKEIKRLGLTAVAKTAATTNDVLQAAQAVARQADVIYIPTDNVVVAAMSSVGTVSQQTHTPVVTADAPSVKLAGVATVGINYEDLGRQTAKLAIKLLKGKKPAQVPVEVPAKLRLTMNSKRMAQFHLTQAQVKAAAKVVKISHRAKK